MILPDRPVRLPAFALAASALLAAGCGSAPVQRVPSMSQLSRLRGHLADARAATTARDRAGAIAALSALDQDVAVLRRQGALGPALAATLQADVAQARSRAGIELPLAAPAPPPTASPATTAPPAATPGAGSTAPGAGPPAGAQPQDQAAADGKPKDHGDQKPKDQKPKDHPPPKPKDHGHGGD